MTALQSHAYAIMRIAKHAGIITPAERCEHCGLDKPLDGHHEDYFKPLELTWLCVKCHNARHRELGWGIGGRKDTLPKSERVVRKCISMPVRLYRFAVEQAAAQGISFSKYIANLIEADCEPA